MEQSPQNRYAPGPRRAPYAAPMGALANVTQSLAKQAIEQPVRANPVAPVLVFLASADASYVSGGRMQV